MEFTLEQAKELVKMFGNDDEITVTVVEKKDSDMSHSGPGLYAFETEYPEDGSIWLG